MRRPLARARLSPRRASTRSGEVQLVRRLLSIAACLFAGSTIAPARSMPAAPICAPTATPTWPGWSAPNSKRNQELADKVAALRKDVDSLAKGDGGGVSERAMAEAAALAGQAPVRGPAVAVVLDDAPSGVHPGGSALSFWWCTSRTFRPW